MRFATFASRCIYHVRDMTLSLLEEVVLITVILVVLIAPFDAARTDSRDTPSSGALGGRYTYIVCFGATPRHPRPAVDY